MGVTSERKELSVLLPRDQVTELWAQRAYRRANALYEALWDATPPGGSGRTYQGHDHTPQGGGGPINRGCLWSACTLETLTELSFSAKNQSQEIPGSPNDSAMVHASPGLRTSALLTGWICYYARNSDRFRLELAPEGTIYDFDLEVGSGESAIWQKFVVPLAWAGEWKARNFYVRCGSYDSDNSPAVSIYAIQLDELVDTMGRGGVPETERPASTGSIVLVSFPVLEDELVAADEWVDAFALRELYAFGNGLYEGTGEMRAPGASSQTCYGHDHDPSNHGGRIIARGGCYTASLGATTYLYRIAWNGISYSGYQAWDLDDGADRRSAASVGMALFWCSPGMTSSGSPPSSEPYLTARLFVQWNAGMASPTMRFRAKHISTGNYSAVTEIAATASYSDWVTVDYIPCEGDDINELQWEVEMVGTMTTVNIDLYAFVVYEVPGEGARSAPGGRVVLALGVD